VYKMCVRVRALLCLSCDRRHGRAGQGVRPATGRPRSGRRAGQPNAGQIGGYRRWDPCRAPGPPRQVRPGWLHRPGHGRSVRPRRQGAARARGGRAGQQRRAVVPAPRVLLEGRRRPVRWRGRWKGRLVCRMGTATVWRHDPVQHHVHGQHVPTGDARHGRSEARVRHKHRKHRVPHPVPTVDDVRGHQGNLRILFISNVVIVNCHCCYHRLVIIISYYIIVSTPRGCN